MDPNSVNPVIKYIKASTPDIFRKPSAKVAFDVAVFSAAAFIIIKFGTEMAQTFEDITPSEQSVMRELKAAQDQMLMQQQAMAHMQQGMM